MSDFRYLLIDAVTTHLDTGLTAVDTVFKGRVPDTVPTITGDTAGHVNPYVVLYPSPGAPSDDQDVADTHIDLIIPVQITCAAAFLDDLLALVDRVDTLMNRWTPTVAGASCSQFRPPLGYNPGPARVDQDIHPPRLWLPLQYQTTLTT